MNLFKPKPDDPFKPFPHPLKNTNIFRFYGSEARWWASHEFFYPDLDAAWYKFDPHAALIASLVPPGVELTWRQWKMIRRQFNRPRRFSQTFITSQLSKRNRFRRMIRKLQRHSDSGKTHNFPVPPILQPGTTVKAYIRRSRIVSKGNVLFYSPGDHGYMVQFDAEELGCEFCPDTDVARFSTTANASVPGSGNTSSRASNHSPLDAPVLLENDPFYERYSLVSLIATIERAKERKKVILDAMQENNRFVFPSLRSNRANSFEPHTERWDAFQRSSSAWLHANLILTNQSLQESLELLRSLYLKKLALPKISRFVQSCLSFPTGCYEYSLRSLHFLL